MKDTRRGLHFRPDWDEDQFEMQFFAIAEDRGRESACMVTIRRGGFSMDLHLKLTTVREIGYKALLVVDDMTRESGEPRDPLLSAYLDEAASLSDPRD